MSKWLPEPHLEGAVFGTYYLVCSLVLFKYSLPRAVALWIVMGDEISRCQISHPPSWHILLCYGGELLWEETSNLSRVWTWRTRNNERATLKQFWYENFIYEYFIYIIPPSPSNASYVLPLPSNSWPFKKKCYCYMHIIYVYIYIYRHTHI